MHYTTISDLNFYKRPALPFRGKPTPPPYFHGRAPVIFNISECSECPCRRNKAVESIPILVTNNILLFHRFKPPMILLRIFTVLQVMCCSEWTFNDRICPFWLEAYDHQPVRPPTSSMAVQLLFGWLRQRKFWGNVLDCMFDE